MNYKIGDRIVIKSEDRIRGGLNPSGRLRVDGRYLMFNSRMYAFCGWSAKIIKVLEPNSEHAIRYMVKFDETKDPNGGTGEIREWVWAPQWIEPEVKEYFDDNLFEL